MNKAHFIDCIKRIEKHKQTKFPISKDEELLQDYWNAARYLSDDKMDAITEAIVNDAGYFPKLPEFKQYVRAQSPRDAIKAVKHGAGSLSGELLEQRRCGFVWQYKDEWYGCGAKLKPMQSYYCERCQEIDDLYRSGALDKIYLTTDGKSIKSFTKKYEKIEPEEVPETVEIDDLPF